MKLVGENFENRHPVIYIDSDFARLKDLACSRWMEMIASAEMRL
jgi:hypothetical protein